MTTVDSGENVFVMFIVSVSMHVIILTLIVEAVYSVNRCTLMVSSQQKKVFWVLYLVSQQEADGFQGLLASVYIVTQEQVVALWWKASIFKQPQEIIVLPMNITWKEDGGGLGLE